MSTTKRLAHAFGVLLDGAVLIDSEGRAMIYSAEYIAQNAKRDVVRGLPHLLQQELAKRIAVEPVELWGAR